MYTRYNVYKLAVDVIMNPPILIPGKAMRVMFKSLLTRHNNRVTFIAKPHILFKTYFEKSTLICPVY